MAYRIHHIEGIVLQAEESGEFDRSLMVYSREYGLIYISAKSVRRSVSKRRFAIQIYSRAKMDLVHGKRGWILASAGILDTNRDLWLHAGRARVFAEGIEFLKRLVRGPEPEPALYDDIVSFCEYLGRAEKEQVCRAIGLLFMIRTLVALGYWEEKLGDEKFLKEEYSRDALLAVLEERQMLVKRVGRALEATQL